MSSLSSDAPSGGARETYHSLTSGTGTPSPSKDSLAKWATNSSNDQQQQQISIKIGGALPVAETSSSSLRLCIDERAESESGRSDKRSEMEKTFGFGFATPERIEVDRSRGPTPSAGDDDIDDRMSVSSRVSTRSTTRITPHKMSGDNLEKDISYNAGASPAHAESKLNLAMIPVISDQLLHDIVNKERSIEHADVYLFVKKCLDLLASRNTAEHKIEHLKQKIAELESENRAIRETNVRMQLRVEQEEEYISNMLLKRIQKLKSDKEQLAQKFEQEEEHLTNDLMRKLNQLEGERDELALKLGQEQSWVVGNLLAKIRKLETEIQTNQKSLEQLRREKVDLENSLEHEQESLFNTLGKRMDQLQAEKQRLQQQNDHLQAQNLLIQQRLTSSKSAIAGEIEASSSTSDSSLDIKAEATDTTSSSSPPHLVLPSTVSHSVPQLRTASLSGGSPSSSRALSLSGHGQQLLRKPRNNSGK